MQHHNLIWDNDRSALRAIENALKMEFKATKLDQS